MTAAGDLDGQVLGFVTDKPGSSVWELCQRFPQVESPARWGSPRGPGALPLEAPAQMTPSVTPAQVIGSLHRLERDGRVTVVKSGEWQAEHWYPTTY
jgi:hypothetical protein